MRKIIFFLFVGFMASAFTANAQLKFGHIDTQELLKAMPERDSADKQLAKYRNDLLQSLEEMKVEMNKKYEEFTVQNKTPTWSEVQRQDKEREAQNMYARVQEYEESLSGRLQEQHSKLYAPIIEKSRNAISKLAKAQGLIYVFETGNVLYFNETQSIDLLPADRKSVV